MVTGRDRRASRSAWRSRASATARSCKAATWSWRSVTRIRWRSRRPRDRVRGARSRRGSPSAAPPSSRSARSPRSSVSSASPSPTRARGSATRASTSPGRLVSAHDREDQARRAAKRRRRVRAKVRGTAERPRISVFRSNRGIFAQLIDDDSGRTLASVNWTEAELRASAGWSRPTGPGQLLAERAKAAGVEHRACSTAAATSTTARQGARRRRPRGRARVLSRYQPLLWIAHGT